MNEASLTITPSGVVPSGTRIEGYTLFEKGVQDALECYSNVHRGSGHYSQVITRLYESARSIITGYSGKNTNDHFTLFCSPRRAARLTEKMKPGSYLVFTSHELGLPLGITALVADRDSLPGGIPAETGGGITRMVSTEWVLWAKGPDRFEAGTPAIIPAIALARALQLTRSLGKDVFRSAEKEQPTIEEILYRDDYEGNAGMTLLENLRKTMIGRHFPVPTMNGERPFINFDQAASTPSFAPVMKTWFQVLKQPPARYHTIVEETRNIVHDFLGAPGNHYDVIFTSGTTEAVNLAAESLSREQRLDSVEPVILGSVLEHSSNDLPWRTVSNHSMIRLSVDNEGFFDLDELDSLLRAYNENGTYGKKRIGLVALSGASNIMGTYNDLKKISLLVHRFGARLMVDAAQLIAHRPVNLSDWDIDYLVFSAHKVYAPFGSGALVVKKGILAFDGAEMEEIRSSGEENVAGIAALGKSLVLLKRIGFDSIMEEESRLTRQLVSGLTKIKGVKVVGIGDTESPRFNAKGGVVMFELKGRMPHKLASDLAIDGGIGVRYGCHCAHIMVKRLAGVGPGIEKFQKLLLTLFPHINLPGFVRVSLGIGNTGEEVDWLLTWLSNSGSSLEQGEGISKPEVKRQIEAFIRGAENSIFGDVK